MKPSTNIVTFRTDTVVIPGTTVHTIPHRSIIHVRTQTDTENTILIGKSMYTTSRAMAFIETFCLHGAIAYLNE